MYVISVGIPEEIPQRHATMEALTERVVLPTACQLSQHGSVQEEAI